MDASTLCPFKFSSSFVSKTEGRTDYSRRLGQSIVKFAVKKTLLSTESFFTYAFIVDFSSINLLCLVITEQGVESLPLAGIFFDGRYKAAPYTGAYTIHNTPILIILSHEML